jgi:hypothetical protein
MSEQEAFKSAEALPRAAAPVQLSYPPDLNGEMLRWLAKDENMAQVSSISKRVVVLAPDILRTISGRLADGMPEAELSHYVERSVAYDWYKKDVELPASPQTLIDLVKTANAHGVELNAISSGSYSFDDTDKSIAQDNGPVGEQIVSTAFNAAINPLMALAKYVVSASEASEDTKKKVVYAANIRADNTIQILSDLRTEYGVTPEVIFYPERKYNSMADLPARYEAAFGEKLTVLAMPLTDEARIDLQKLQQLQQQTQALEPAAMPASKPQSGHSAAGWGNG